jgi:hypothetical protein
MKKLFFISHCICIYDITVFQLKLNKLSDFYLSYNVLIVLYMDSVLCKHEGIFEFYVIKWFYWTYRKGKVKFSLCLTNSALHHEGVWGVDV